MVRSTSMYACPPPQISSRPLRTSRIYCKKRSSAINLSGFFSRRTPLRVIQKPPCRLQPIQFSSNSMVFFRGFNSNTLSDAHVFVTPSFAGCVTRFSIFRLFPVAHVPRNKLTTSHRRPSTPHRRRYLIFAVTNTKTVRASPPPAGFVSFRRVCAHTVTSTHKKKKKHGTLIIKIVLLSCRP